MALFAVDHVLMTSTTGANYKAVYISKTELVQDNLEAVNHQQYFHECSLATSCNYVVRDKKSAIKLYNTSSEVPPEEEVLGIWMKMQSKLLHS